MQYFFLLSKLYGGAISGLLMSVLARLFTVYLQHHGFTLGIEDILVESPADVKRKEIMQEAKTCGDAAALEALNVTSNNKLVDIKFLKERLDLHQC